MHSNEGGHLGLHLDFDSCSTRFFHLGIYSQYSSGHEWFCSSNSQHLLLVCIFSFRCFLFHTLL